MKMTKERGEAAILQAACFHFLQNFGPDEELSKIANDLRDSEADKDFTVGDVIEYIKERQGGSHE